MKKLSLILLFILIAFSGYTQTPEEIQAELEANFNAAAKIVFLDAFDFKNELAKRAIHHEDILKMESYDETVRDHCVRLWRSDNKTYAKYGHFLNTIMEVDLAFVYAWNGEPEKAYNEFKFRKDELEKYADDDDLYPFRFKVGDMNYTVQQASIKSELFHYYQTMGVISGRLQKLDESELYWNLILRFPGVSKEDAYDANQKLIDIKKYLLANKSKEDTRTNDDEMVLLDSYIKNFRLLCYMKYKDRQALKGKKDPYELYNSAKALSDKHPEFDRSYEIDTTGAKGFMELGDYPRSAELFTKWLESIKGSDELACWGIFCGIQANDTKLVNLAIKNLEKENWTGYCFAFQMLKEGYEFLGNKKKAKYWRKKDDKCMGR